MAGGTGVKIDDDGTLAYMTIRKAPNHHFPYDCPNSHCQSVDGHCTNCICREQIHARLGDIESSRKASLVWSDKLREDVGNAEAKIRQRWGDVYETSNELEDIYYLTKGTCRQDSCECCKLETLEREWRAIRLRLAMRQEKLEALNDYIDLRSLQEKSHRDEIAQQTTALAEARSQLQAEILEVEHLEHTAECIYDPARHPKLDLNAEFWRQVKRDETLPSASAACDCKRCTYQTMQNNIENAVERTENYKKRLQRNIRDMRNTKTALQLERERIQEMAQQDSPYGRTGSYRGFGTGSLKPRRHLNSNSANVAAAEDPPGKKKKSKRPALVW